MKNKDKSYYNDDGKLHRTGNKPATIYSNGDCEYWENGELHRTGNQPAIDWKLMRVWYVNGVKHRDDGPAIVWSDGRSEWWIEGVKQ